MFVPTCVWTLLLGAYLCFRLCGFKMETTSFSKKKLGLELSRNFHLKFHRLI
uniref:Uncharacterized protein n=1 Tax=Arundo donax TaxID=35708 RepID=A0A0A9F0C0_ARUDO